MEQKPRVKGLDSSVLFPSNLLKHHSVGFIDRPLTKRERTSKNLFMLKVNSAISAIERDKIRYGEPFYTIDEKRWIDNLAQDCFLVNDSIEQGEYGNRIGHLAFAYGLIEVQFIKDLQRRTGISFSINDVPHEDVFRLFRDENLFNDAMEKTLPALRVLFQESDMQAIMVDNAPLIEPDQARMEMMENVHMLRYVVVNRMKSMGDVAQETPYFPLVLPVFTMARGLTFIRLNDEIKQAGKQVPFFTKELELVMADLIYSEIPPKDPTKAELFFRKFWGRMVVFGRDFYLRHIRAAAFEWVNNIYNYTTGKSFYAERYQEGITKELTNLFTFSKDEYHYTEAATPKSVYALLENTFQDGNLVDELVKLAKKYDYGKNGEGDLAYLQHKLYFIVGRERISILDFLVRQNYSFRKLFTPTTAEPMSFGKRISEIQKFHEIKDFLEQVANSILKIKDKDRLRVNFETNEELDRFCREVIVEQDPEATVWFEVLQNGQETATHMKVANLIKQEKSVAGEMDKFYKDNLGKEGVQRVFANVFTYTDQGEALLMTKEQGYPAWWSRHMLKRDTFSTFEGYREPEQH